MKLSFPDVFIEAVFLEASPFLQESFPPDHHTNTHHLAQFKVNIKYKAGLLLTFEFHEVLSYVE